MRGLCQTGHVRGFHEISRRVLLGQLACAAGWAQTAANQAALSPAESDPLRPLRSGHPRLVLLDSELDRIRAGVRDNALAKRVFGDLEKESDRLLSIPPVEYKLNGTRLQMQTRRAVDRITTLALMFRLTGKDPLQLKRPSDARSYWHPARDCSPLERLF